MTDKVERVVVIDHAEMARRNAEAQLAADPAETEQFRATIPGGRYGTADGRFVDAHGREITEDGELVGEPQATPATPASMQLGGPEVTDAAKAQAEGSESEQWRKDMLDQRRESADNPVEGAPFVVFTTLPALEDEEVDESGKKTGRKVKRAPKRGKK
jgi:hypothetical protein